MEQSLIDFAKDAYKNHDEAHNYEHALQVWKNALIIIERENLTLTKDEYNELPFIMVCHDINDYKIVARGLGLSEETINNFYKQYLSEKSIKKISLPLAI